MQKKVFLQKNSQKGGGGSPYLKYLLIAAVGLLLLVIVTPYLLKEKGKDVPRRAVPEKGVHKELPKPPEPAPREAVPDLAKPVEPVQPPKPAQPPETARLPEPAKPAEPAPAAPQKILPEIPPTAQAPAPEPAQPPAAKPADPAPKDLFPKKGTPAGKTPGTAGKQPAETGRQAGKPAVAAKTDAGSPVKPAADVKGKPEAGKQLYAVQVGCFKEKSDAETVRRNLGKRGYSVILCPSGTVGGKYAYTVITRPVASASKAATLAEQMKSEPKTSPTVVKAPGAVCNLPAAPPAKPAQKPKPKVNAPQN